MSPEQKAVRSLLTPATAATKHVSLSQEASLFKQENKWTLLGGCRVLQGRLIKTTAVPELEPLEVVWALLDVILEPLLLEEKLLVGPERRYCLGARD